MIHQPLGGAQGQASDIRIQADEILFLKDRLNQEIADRTGQPLTALSRTRTEISSCLPLKLCPTA